MAIWQVQWIAAALLMRAGLALHAVGSVRSKNAGSTMGRQLLDWALAVLAFWAVGAAIAFQSNTSFIGFEFAHALGRWLPAFFLTALAPATIVGAMFIGATAERSRIWPMLLLSIVTAGLTLPVVMTWTGYFGWLSHLHFTSGGGLFVVGGMTALVATVAVGPRDGKYHRDGSASLIPGHNLTFVIFGTLLFAIGAVIYIAAESGAGDGKQVVNALLAAAASVVAASLYCQFSFSKIDLTLVTSSLIAGVVSMTSASTYVAGWGAVLIGAVAGLIATACLIKFDLALRIDDVSGTVCVCGLAGAWGMIVAVPYDGTAPADIARAMLVQLLGLVAIALFSAVLAAITLKIAGRFVKLRVNDADEFDGLDLAEHDVAAYPDFQQNTIKSYHMREA
jgi:Amt family ammonium transporter